MTKIIIGIGILIAGSFLFIKWSETKNAQLLTIEKRTRIQVQDTEETKQIPQNNPQSAPRPNAAPIGLNPNPPTSSPLFKKGELLAKSEQAEIVLSNRDVLPSDLAGEVYIDFNRDLIGGLKSGEKFSIPIPQLDKAFTAEVEEIVSHKNGDQTVRAKLVNEQDDYSVTITQGKDATYATISTPEGVYMLEASGNAGWVASRTDLRQNHNYQVTDAVLPPEVIMPTPPPLPTE